MKLVIVESPTKAKTISSFLGKEYKVISSYGHVRDLPKSKLGIDEEDFTPKYVIPTKVRKKVSELKKEAKDKDEIILATDEDREGEAIAWHIANILDIDKNSAKRIVFHEITEQEINNSIANPRKISMNLVDAQQARRVLDRLVGYNLSPFLWKKIARGLSAGRVQSVALRIIVEREKEIEKFKPEEYWEINASLLTEKKEVFEASLIKINGKKIETGDISNEKDTEKLISELERATYEIQNVVKKNTKKNPLPPFITSTLQQEAYKRLRLTSKQTMRFAQSLYENGLITYMRTDSLNLSSQSTEKAKELINTEFGKEYSLSKPRIFKKKSKNAQEAHEAIRPTDPFINPTKSKINKIKDEKAHKLYELIWRRFIGSQMKEAEFINTSIKIVAKNENEFIFSASGSVKKFDGFLKVWESKYSELEFPELKEQEKISLDKLKPSQHFTQPPARYNDASLIKAMEEYGIGRPSTYAPTISTIQSRNYIEKNEQRRFQPTEIGIKVNDMLVENFPEIVDIKFTANMEDDLDKVAEGEKNWKDIIKSFYTPFKENLESKYEKVESQKPEPEMTDIKCDKCGKPMVIKYSRFGKFLACSGFPECKNAKSIEGENGNKNKTFGKCPECKEGNIVLKKTRKGRFFYGCSKYPDCEHASWKKPETSEED